MNRSFSRNAVFAFHVLLLALLALSSTQCALLTKADPMEPKYYSPEPAMGRAAPTLDSATPLAASAAPGAQSNAPKTQGGAPMELRLGRVRGATHLREKMVYRESNYELGIDEERRWTERPEEYLRRALERALFEEQRLRHVVAGIAPVLDVELVDFEEIRAPKHVARVRATYALRDEYAVLRGGTVTVDQPIKGSDGDAVAESIGVALHAVVEDVAKQTVAGLDAILPP